jgi:hypothetical protein
MGTSSASRMSVKNWISASLTAAKFVRNSYSAPLPSIYCDAILYRLARRRHQAGVKEFSRGIPDASSGAFFPLVTCYIGILAHLPVTCRCAKGENLDSNTMVVFTRFGMGDAPAELQKKLAGVFLNLLLQDSIPGVIACYGEGVKLACEGSPVLDALRAVTVKGARLILCQTCLDYFGLRDTVRVGIVGGMGDIVAAMSSATKVISV